MKILIFGIPGSGKTVLAHKISKALKLPICHIDRLFFHKGWVERDKEAFLKDVKTVLETKSWIIDGNGMRTIEMRYKEADIALYCRLPRWLCLYRIFYRNISTYGSFKEDGPDGSTNSFSWRLIQYLWRFPKKYRELILQLRKTYPHVKFMEISSKKLYKEALDSLCSLKS
ncbi:MAG: AAA family ATPase [Verrucomicrobia bacterium]|nr:AAA family ATPase [Verrucomicrobiota bacterium]